MDFERDKWGGTTEINLITGAVTKHMDMRSAYPKETSNVAYGKSSSSDVDILHADCVACRSKNDSAEVATLVLLRMLLAGCDWQDIVKDLCFAHRRKIQ